MGRTDAERLSNDNSAPAASARFTVDADPDRSLIRIGLSGFFIPAEIVAFGTAMRAAHARLTCGINGHRTIVDVRDLKIQSQEAVAGFRTLLARPEFKSRRLAFVVSPTLARSQLLRALGDREARTFDAVRPAEVWVLAEDAVTRPATRSGTTDPALRTRDAR